MSEISREDLKQHCIKKIAIREEMNKNPKIHFDSDKVYQEHKMILDMIERFEKIEKVLDTTLIAKEPYKAKIEAIKQIVEG